MAKLFIEETVSAKITVSDIDAATWQKIKEFVTQAVKEVPVVLVSDDKPTASDAMFMASVPTDTLAEAFDLNKPKKKTARTAATDAERKRQLSCYTGSNVVQNELEKARKNPDTKWAWQTAREWMETNPHIAPFSIYAVSHVLGALNYFGKVGMDHTQRANGHRYYLPVYEAESERFGRVLRDLRVAHDLSAEDLADMIGYSRDIVIGWENGTMVCSPDSDGYKKLRTLFGNEWDERFAA